MIFQKVYPLLSHPHLLYVFPIIPIIIESTVTNDIQDAIIHNQIIYLFIYSIFLFSIVLNL